MFAHIPRNSKSPIKLWFFLTVFLSITNTSTAYRSSFYPRPHHPEPDSENYRRSFRQIQPNNLNWNGIENQRRALENDAIFFEDDYPDLNAIPQRPWQERTTRAPPTTTVAIPGMGTTRSPCEQACLVTSEYNPVCGSNGLTYSNERRLNCAVNCGKRKN